MFNLMYALLWFPVTSSADYGTLHSGTNTDFLLSKYNWSCIRRRGLDTLISASAPRLLQCRQLYGINRTPRACIHSNPPRYRFIIHV